MLIGGPLRCTSSRRRAAFTRCMAIFGDLLHRS
jgi:hypothetical protein